MPGLVSAVDDQTATTSNTVTTTASDVPYKDGHCHETEFSGQLSASFVFNGFVET